MTTHRRPARCRLPLATLGVGIAVGLVSLGRAVADGPGQAASQNPPDKEDAPAKPAVVRPPAPEKAPDITEDLKGSVTDREPIPPWVENNPPPEAKAYCLALIQARGTSPRAFANSARRDVTFAHLFEEPAKYRGQVVHFEGRLARLRKFDPPRYVRGDAFGIDALYEGWVVDMNLYGANPVCVVFTDLPPGLAVQEKLDVPVAFDAYFFKRYRYRAGDGTRDSPLFIGHTLSVKHDQAIAAKNSMSDFTGTLIIAFLAMLVATAGVAVLLHWLYRRGDRRIHRIMAGANPPVFVEPGANAEAVDGHPDGEVIDEYPGLRNGLKHGRL